MFEKKIKEAIKLYDLAGVHPAANLLPFMTPAEYEGLLADVGKNGFLHPVRVDKDGYLLDGRNRLCASIDLGKDVRIEVFETPDPIAYVLSENIQRRHLTAGQQAAVGSDAEELYREEAKERRLAGLKQNQTVPPNSAEREAATCRLCGEEFSYIPGPCTYGQNVCNHCSARENHNERREHETRTKAANLVGARPQAISEFKQVEREDPALAQEVRAGTVKLGPALKEVKQRQAVKAKPTFNQTTDSIKWAKWTWNPVTGCLHGCPYCYARDLTKRYPDGFPNGFDPAFYPERLTAPENTKLPARKDEGHRNVFVCSMADLFGEWVEQEWIDQILDACRKAPEWTFIFLTKNPKRLVGQQWPGNAWVGTTVDCQERVAAAVAAFTELANRENRPPVTFLSCEPLAERLDFGENGLFPFDWVIIGGRSSSSGMPAGQPDWEWVEKLHYDARVAGCKVAWKPNLTVRPFEYPA
jgi:protein gp37